MKISNKTTFTVTNANDLLEKLKVRLEAIGLTTALYTDNIISSINIGKRLHINIGTSFLNIASSISVHPINPTSTNWSSANLQVLAACVSRNLNSSIIWSANETLTNGYSVPCVQLNNNSECWIFTTDNSFTIVTNYDNLKYSLMYVSWENGILTISSNKSTRDTSTPLNTFNTLFNSNLDFNYCNQMIKDGSYFNGTFANYENHTNYKYTYSNIYLKMFNLVNNTSIMLPNNLFIDNGSSASVRYSLIKQVKDLSIVNMKNLDPKYIFNITSKEYIVFPNNIKDGSINNSMGYCFRNV